MDPLTTKEELLLQDLLAKLDAAQEERKLRGRGRLFREVMWDLRKRNNERNADANTKHED